MSSAAEPKVYGWCPGALRPMMSGDGLVVRVRAPLGKLSVNQARGVARLSQEFGNGLLDISARANLQMRGIREDAHEDLIAGLRELGLIDPDANAEARRNVLLAPFWAEGDDTHTIATDLSAALTAATDLTLPGKFGFAVDCGAAPVLQDIAADIRIERSGSSLILRADGSETGKPVTRESAVPEALALARWFVETGGAANGRGRMKPHVAKGIPLPAHHTTLTISANFTAKPGPVPAGTLAALEFGQMPAAALAQLADCGDIRLTPWRMLLVEGAESLPPLPGLILDAADPRLQVVACTGAPGCLQALSATRDLARQLAPHVPAGTRLHVSGCAKGCACPGAAPLTLTATGDDEFSLIRNGTAADQPLKTHLSADALRAAPELLTEGS
ncbi:precorrin-3B synthase [Leisingera aquaemixtae]|uniref:precorrin-3B synthase n=1 Tax=Leisingera aquaemixtae TaxID=1396826 RepID=UPI001C951B01|nr:precorrin-3B synthase [Leisingera aquaemixtae]MBY6068172.1 precorrin-3B synthase [Leisingera aquaemixtae]